MVKPLTWKTFELFSSKPFHLGKTFFCELCFYFSKTFIASWLDLYKLEKLIILLG